MRILTLLILALLLPAAAFAGPVEDGKTPSIAGETIVINGKDYGLTKESVRKKISELSKVAGEDIYYANYVGITKIDMEARKRFFTDKGWIEYQQYVSLAKSRLERMWVWNIDPVQNSEQFLAGEKDGLVISYDCNSAQREGDQVGGGSQCHLLISFTKNPETTDILISSWKFTPVGLDWPPSLIPDAVTHLKQKAEGGDLRAQLKLYEMYGPSDQNETTKWCRMAANNGDVLSQRRVAYLYKMGEGTPQDDGEAYFWYSLALQNGDQNQYNDKLARDALATKLTPEQKAAIDKRLAEWKPTPARPADTKQ